MKWDDVRVGDKIVDQDEDKGEVVEAGERRIVVDFRASGLGLVSYYREANDIVVDTWRPLEPDLGEAPMKERYSLIPPDLLREVALVLTQGASKVDPASGKTYTDFGWRSMLEEQGYEKVRSIYYDSLMRHLNASLRGEEVDAGSGLSPLVHVICNAFILRDLERLNKEEA